MRTRYLGLAVTLVMLAGSMAGQNPAAKPKAPATAAETGEKATFPGVPADIQTLLEANIRAEWEAIKHRDKAEFSKLLTEDFIQVEADGDGARNRFKAANELAESFLEDYHLQLFRMYTFSPTITYVRYENTMRFPVRSALRFKRMWISEIWVKQGGEWKLWRYQETPVK